MVMRVWPLLALANAVLLRREAVPSLEEYLGFAPDEDVGNASDLASALAPFLPVNAVHNHTNGTDTTRISCPGGVTANTAQLEYRLNSAPRLYAVKSAPTFEKPTYIFVIVPPGYGSTALMSLLATSPHVGTLCTCGDMCLNCEGCYILYAKRVMLWANRWNRDAPSSWVAAVNAWEQFYPKGKTLKLEKSPNNIVKTAEIARQLTAAGNNVRFVVMSRSPCFVSTHGLHGAGMYVETWEFFAKEMLASLTRKSSGAGSVKALHVRYEDLLADPYEVSQQLLDFLPQLESLDPTENPLPSQGGKMYGGKDNGRAKSVVQYLLEYKHIPADHRNVAIRYRGLMEQLGYAAPSVEVPVIAR